jgi:hypothetical protein
MTFKKILWIDRNFFFALLHQGIAYFVFFGFLEIFTLYVVTVLEIKHELLISIAQCAALFGTFLYEMFALDINFFEKHGYPSKSNKDLAFTWILALLCLCFFYILRSFISFNSYVFLILISICHIIFCISFCHIITINNYLIE